MLAAIKIPRDEAVPILALTTSSRMSTALGLPKHLPEFPFLGLEQHEIAIISNVSLNIAEGTPQLYNELETQYVKIRIHSRDVNLRSK